MAAIFSNPAAALIGGGVLSTVGSAIQQFLAGRRVRQALQQEPLAGPDLSETQLQARFATNPIFQGLSPETQQIFLETAGPLFEQGQQALPQQVLLNAEGRQRAADRAQQGVSATTETRQRIQERADRPAISQAEIDAIVGQERERINQQMAQTLQAARSRGGALGVPGDVLAATRAGLSGEAGFQQAESQRDVLLRAAELNRDFEARLLGLETTSATPNLQNALQFAAAIEGTPEIDLASLSNASQLRAFADLATEFQLDQALANALAGVGSTGIGAGLDLFSAQNIANAQQQPGFFEQLGGAFFGPFAATAGAGSAAAGLSAIGGSGGAAAVPWITGPLAFSDKNMKQEIEPIQNPDEWAEKVKHMPVSTWRYTWEPDGVLHIGPMAQDWVKFFDMGDGRTINLIDGLGVLLVTNKALMRRIEHLESRLAKLEANG